MYWKRVVLFLLLLHLFNPGFAQITKIRGCVTDAQTGEPIPFAGVFLKGTTSGVTSNLDGSYLLETRDTTSTLVCQLLGYDVVETRIKVAAYNKVDFALNLTENRLVGATVKADNKKVRRLLANIDAHRDRNNPEKLDCYRVNLYNKMELDLTNAKEQIRNKAFLKNFSFVFEYMDTSAVSGVPYLPVMISESFVDRQHSTDPENDTETVLANRISGIDPQSNMLSQFTGSLHLKANFYNSFINGFGIEFPSPIQKAGLLYYNYYIVDTLQIDSRKTYLVHYHPKAGISSAAFDGEMQIDAEDFALRSIHAKMKHGGNVNWLRDIVLDAEYKRLNDSIWFYDRDRLYADFSIALGDSSKIMSVIGTRDISYSNPSLIRDSLDMDARSGKVKVFSDENNQDEKYWESKRPYALSERERNIYEMVEKVQDVPMYKDLYSIVYTLVTGYWDIGPIGIGPYAKIISFNNLEGFRPQIGIHTSKDFSRKFRFTGFLAYGVRDKEFKGGLTYERLFCKDPTSKLTLDAHYDVFQLGRGASYFTDQNILSSLFGKGDANRLCPMTSFSAMYEKEFSMNFNFQADLALKRYFSNVFVPMGDFTSIATNEVHLSARFSRDETVNRGHFIKKYIHSDWPVFTLNMTGSIPGLRKNDFAFFRPEFSMSWRKNLPPVGLTKLSLNAGTIIGTVPYPLLHLHEGNGTYMLDKTAFSCMDYFEFASDSWATLFWVHNFNGFFFGKIPLVRKLKLREELTFKMAYGSLRDANRNAYMPFPAGMKTIDGIPYMEVGAGVSNILKLFRVDCFWRLTHRENARQLFTVNFGVDFRF